MKKLKHFLKDISYLSIEKDIIPSESYIDELKKDIDEKILFKKAKSNKHNILSWLIKPSFLIVSIVTVVTIVAILPFTSLTNEISKAYALTKIRNTVEKLTKADSILYTKEIQTFYNDNSQKDLKIEYMNWIDQTTLESRSESKTIRNGSVINDATSISNEYTQWLYHSKNEYQGPTLQVIHKFYLQRPNIHLNNEKQSEAKFDDIKYRSIKSYYEIITPKDNREIEYRTETTEEGFLYVFTVHENEQNLRNEENVYTFDEIGALKSIYTYKINGSEKNLTQTFEVEKIDILDRTEDIKEQLFTFNTEILSKDTEIIEKYTATSRSDYKELDLENIKYFENENIKFALPEGYKLNKSFINDKLIFIDSDMFSIQMHPYYNYNLTNEYSPIENISYLLNEDNCPYKMKPINMTNSNNNLVTKEYSLEIVYLDPKDLNKSNCTEIFVLRDKIIENNKILLYGAQAKIFDAEKKNYILVFYQVNFDVFSTDPDSYILSDIEKNIETFINSIYFIK